MSNERENGDRKYPKLPEKPVEPLTAEGFVELMKKLGVNEYTIDDKEDDQEK